MVTALAPSSGAPGDSVTITGGGFLSADGTILVRFGGVVAPTRCPEPSTCVATVPAAAPAATGTAGGVPAGTVPVTVTTTAGTSNALAFRYG